MVSSFIFESMRNRENYTVLRHHNEGDNRINAVDIVEKLRTRVYVFVCAFTIIEFFNLE